MRSFLDNIELWLSGLGLLVIWVVPMLLRPVFADAWQTTAVTAIIVGVLHGLIFWSVRRRQRTVRNQAIQEITRMLQDRINNDLSVILMNVSSSSRRAQETDLQLLQSTQERILRISQHVRTLSEESLEAWKAKYDDTDRLPRS
jgi:hypothetical protein